MTRKRPSLVEGLAEGVRVADVPGLGRGIGEGLVRVSEAWLPGGKLAVPQPCPVLTCRYGPYGSLAALKSHLLALHAGMSDRERSYTLDTVRRTAVRQAMNGAPR